jgi:hypothetical protein
MRLAHMVPVPAHGPRMVTEERIRFCTHCGCLFEGEPPEDKPHRERVCSHCGLGVLLYTAREMLSRDGEAFLVVHSDLRVSAASESFEELFEVEPGKVGGQPLLGLLDTPIRGSELARRVARAAGGAGDISLLRVELGGARYEARVGRCGDPRAALVVFTAAR